MKKFNGLIILSVSVLIASGLLAQEVDYNYEIQVLSLSAKALDQGYPQIAKGLWAYVHDRALWRDVIEANKTQGEDEKAEMLTKAKKIAHIKLLRDAAQQLSQPSPQLAKELTDLADLKAKKMAQHEQ